MLAQISEVALSEFFSELVTANYKGANEVYQANQSLVSELELRVKSWIFQQHRQKFVDEGLAGHNFIQAIGNSNFRRASAIFENYPELVGKIFSRYYGFIGFYITVRDSELQRELLKTHPEIKVFLETFGDYSDMASDIFLSLLNRKG